MVILTTYLTSKNDPQRNIGWPSDNFDNMRVWYESLNELGLSGVIFHDQLSQEFINKYTNESVRFIKCKVGDRSTNDARFFIYREFLKKFPSYEKVIMTDLFDVEFVKDPFKVIEKEGWLYSGDEKGKGLNHISFVNRVREVTRYKPTHETLLNAGAIGGHSRDVLRLLDEMCRVFRKMSPRINCNMAVYNHSANFIFQDRIVNGEPFTSEFNRFQQDGNFAVRHK